ncbi:MAG: Gfo/Idh/MocA family protein [Candidatus Thorarchaeota archaeon]
MKLKVGLIGAGGFGHVHLSGYIKNINCELVAVSSGTEESAKFASEKFNIPNVYWGDNWKLMLENNELDIVSICSPNYLHAQQTIEAINQNCNILCEKPIAISNEELKNVEEALKNRTLIYFTSFQKRYIPFLPNVKEMIENGVIGQINLIRHVFSHFGPYTSWKPLSQDKWFFDPLKAGGGVLMDLGVHSIDLLRHLIGEFSKVEGYSYNTSCKNIVSEDNCNVLFRFQNEVLGVITVSWCNEPMDIIEIFGTRGMLRVDLHSKNPFSYKPKGLKKNPILKKALKYKYNRSAIPQHDLIDHFINCILKRKQENPSFLDGKRAVEFVLEAYSKL